jgi:hypothetical protein
MDNCKTSWKGPTKICQHISQLVKIKHDITDTLHEQLHIFMDLWSWSLLLKNNLPSVRFAVKQTKQSHPIPNTLVTYGE